MFHAASDGLEALVQLRAGSAPDLILLDMLMPVLDGWRFLEEMCVDYYETATHFFVHANVYPEIPLNEQPLFMLHWEKLLAPTLPHVQAAPLPSPASLPLHG